MAETLTESLVRRLSPIFEERAEKLVQSGIDKFDKFLESAAFELPEDNLSKFDMMTDAMGQLNTTVSELRDGAKTDEELISELTQNVESYNLQEVVPRLEVLSEVVERQKEQPDKVQQNVVQEGSVTNITYVTNNYGGAEGPQKEPMEYIPTEPSKVDNSEEQLGSDEVQTTRNLEQDTEEVEGSKPDKEETSEVEPQLQVKEVRESAEDTGTKESPGAGTWPRIIEEDEKRPDNEELVEPLKMKDVSEDGDTLRIRYEGEKATQVDLNLRMPEVQREESNSSDDKSVMSDEEKPSDVVDEHSESDSESTSEVQSEPTTEVQSEPKEDKENVEESPQTVVDVLSSKEVSKEENAIVIQYEGEGRVVNVMGLKLQMPEVQREENPKPEEPKREEKEEEHEEEESETQEIPELAEILEVLETHSAQIATITTLLKNKEEVDNAKTVDLKRYVKKTVEANSTTTWNKIRNFLRVVLIGGLVFLFKDAIGKVLKHFWENTVRPVVSSAGDWLKKNAPETYAKIERIIQSVKNITDWVINISDSIAKINNALVGSEFGKKLGLHHMITKDERGDFSEAEYRSLLGSSIDNPLSKGNLGPDWTFDKDVAKALTDAEHTARGREGYQAAVDYTGRGVAMHMTPAEYVQSVVHAGAQTTEVDGETFYKHGGEWFNKDYTAFYDSGGVHRSDDESLSESERSQVASYLNASRNNSGYTSLFDSAYGMYNEATIPGMTADANNETGYARSMQFIEAQAKFDVGEYQKDGTDFVVQDEDGGKKVYQLVIPDVSVGDYSSVLGGVLNEGSLYNGKIKVPVNDYSFVGMQQVPKQEVQVTPESTTVEAAPVEPNSGDPVDVAPQFETSQIPHSLSAESAQGSDLDLMLAQSQSAPPASTSISESTTVTNIDNSVSVGQQSKAPKQVPPVINNINHYTTTVVNRIVPNGRSLTD